MEEARKLEEMYDEKLRIEREKQEEEEREKARGERIKSRDQMKEQRAQRYTDRNFKYNVSFNARTRRRNRSQVLEAKNRNFPNMRRETKM